VVGAARTAAARAKLQAILYDLPSADPHTERQVQWPRATPSFLAEQKATPPPPLSPSGRTGPERNEERGWSPSNGAPRQAGKQDHLIKFSQVKRIQPSQFVNGTRVLFS
jgi:hypothetical protein